MPLSSILVGLAMALVVVPFVAGPLLKASDRRRLSQATEAAAPPAAAKQQALAALRELDFDYRTGKVGEEDYAPLRQRLLVEAAQAAQSVADAQPALDDEIETAVRTLRGAKSYKTERACPECHAPARAGNRFCPKCGAALGLACPACQAEVRAADQFCAHCGKTLKAEAVPVS